MMNCNVKKTAIVCMIVVCSAVCSGQTAWPSKTWNNAVNLSSILPSNTAELSGMYWNKDANRLFIISDGGEVYVLQYNKSGNQYTLLGSASNIGGPEGVTQVNNASNEFYTIDEGNYEIRKYVFNTSFNGVTKLHSWKLLSASSPMIDTGNAGPEGIAFIPDSYLKKADFVSSVTGSVYQSTKGMGGLMFLAHQTEGYVWVFDVNPEVNNDFIYVGKYKTNRSESCDLGFDSSTGLLYILHNVSNNSLEITDLRTVVSGSDYKLNMVKEYAIPNPSSGSDNIEGFAISPKYPEDASLGVWLCRDVSKASEITDAIRWFTPFPADGTNVQTAIAQTYVNSQISFYPNPVEDELTICSKGNESFVNTLSIISLSGELMFKKQSFNFPFQLDVRSLPSGMYLLQVTMNQKIVSYFRFIKN